MNKVSVGLFNLPGLQLPEDLEENVINEMKEWVIENKCGMHMTDNLWSFKTESQRDWFILRWSDKLLMMEKE